jgi:hypothetical protein
MTRKQFEAKVIRNAERLLRVPAGWWGTWLDVTNGTVRVRFSSSGWTVSVRGKRVSRHGSRASAVSKASTL